jgi:hypothetical protein
MVSRRRANTAMAWFIRLYMEKHFVKEITLLMGVESVLSNGLGLAYGYGIVAALDYIGERIKYHPKLQK